MSRDVPPDERPSGRGALRGAAVGGAALASVVLLSIAAVRGSLDLWVLAGAVASVGAAALAGWGPRARRPEGARQRGEEASTGAVADALLANIPDPVVLVDRAGTVIEANEAARSVLPGLSRGRPLSFALRSPVVLDGIEEALRTGRPVSVEYGERVPTERAFEVLIRPASSGVVLFFRDLTSARRLEAMRVDFVANASHELRTPLASLLGFIETLQGPARDDAAARERFLAIMGDQARRMTRLIEDLLSLSRIEMRAHVPPGGATDLVAVVAHIVDTLSPMAESEGVRIAVTLSPSPALVRGDRDELLRLCENLIENAIKYGASGGVVEVALTRAALPGGAAGFALLVRDRGPGIPADHLPRLTERFYRVDVTQSRNKGGTGLGLAIVKHIVNRHRGHLAIRSEPGQGAEFTVTLPAAGAADRRPRDGAP